MQPCSLSLLYASHSLNPLPPPPVSRLSHGSPPCSRFPREAPANGRTGPAFVSSWNQVGINGIGVAPAYLVSRAQRTNDFPLLLSPPVLFLQPGQRARRRGGSSARIFRAENAETDKRVARVNGLQENFLTEGNEIAFPSLWRNKLYEVAPRSRLTSRAIIRDNSRVFASWRTVAALLPVAAAAAAAIAAVRPPTHFFFSPFVNR